MESKIKKLKEKLSYKKELLKNYIIYLKNRQIFEYSSEKKTYTNNYWLASPFVRTDANCVTYGINYVGRGYVYRNYLWYSNGDVDSRTSGVRAVVTLSSDLKFTGSSETGWSY